MPGSELARPRPTGTTHAEIDLVGEIKDDHGVTIQNARDKLDIAMTAATAADVARRPIQYETGFTLLPGNYVIKLLARDATTGRIGTFRAVVHVPNLEREVSAAAHQQRRAHEPARRAERLALHASSRRSRRKSPIRSCSTDSS